MQEFSRLSLLIGEENLKTLNTKTVLVLGLGGVGGYTAEALARSGIGSLVLVDYDTVDISNINRQVIALHSTIGSYKTEAFKRRIEDITTTCKVKTRTQKITAEVLPELFSKQIDFVVDACDTVMTKFALIQYCLSNHIPFITCLGTGKRLDPTKLEITELAKTEYDPLAKILRKKVREANIKQKIPVIYSREIPKKIDSNIIASSIFVSSYSGILAAHYVINYFIEKK